MSTAITVLLVLLLAIAVVGKIVNTEVSQSIDASTQVVRYSADIKAKNVDGEYSVLFPNTWANHLAYLSIGQKGKEFKVRPPVSSRDYTEFVVEVPQHDDDVLSFKVQAVFTNLLTPFPTEIQQLDNQLVKLESSHYFYSPYPTVSQKSVYQLASSSVESFTKLSPHSTRGNNLHFGPYKEIEPFTHSPLLIHYVNNYPFAKFSSVIREIEVSHWGSIAIEEMYELKHHGAQLKGGFSRFDYQMKRNVATPSFRNLIAHLPTQANNIYYRDQIGNISTSDIRTTKKGELELEIETRFPIFGGWQTQFYIGYSIPTELALFVNTVTGKYQLKFDYFTIFDNVWVEDMEVKVILPEGCTDIEVNVPYEVEQSRTVRYTFLDAQANGGRTVLILKANNIVEEHDKKVIISYNFPKNKMIVEPLMLVGSFFVLFVVLSIFARGKAEKTTTATEVKKD